MNKTAIAMLLICALSGCDTGPRRKIAAELAPPPAPKPAPKQSAEVIAKLKQVYEVGSAAPELAAQPALPAAVPDQPAPILPPMSSVATAMSPAPARAPVSLQEIKAKAEESGQALFRGDYGKLIDTTYPKVIEMSGGREKMIAAVESGMKDMKAQGYEFLSVSMSPPDRVIPSGDKSFVVVPMTLKMKVPGGVLITESCMVGIGDRDGQNWTFIDGAQLSDEAKMKLIIPEAVGKLPLPAKKQPVFERTS